MIRPADTDSPEARGGTPLAHTERIRVQYTETDMGGAAHAACALLWAERAEHGLLRSLGLRPVFVVDGATSPIPEPLTGTGAAGHVEL